MTEIALFWATVFWGASAMCTSYAERLDAMSDTDWAAAFIEAARQAGYIELPWRPTDDLMRQAMSYFGAGLSPVDAAAGIFGIRH